MLETYITEIIAAGAILILIVIYFIIKKSQQKKENVSNKPEPQDIEETIIEDVYDTAKKETTKESEPININALSGEEEGSFGVEVDDKAVEESLESENRVEEKDSRAQPLARIKKTVPPHGKITKENFKEFAGQKILVAEDNIINQKVIGGLLADSGIEITIADDGQAALDILAQDSDYNFILMDAHMPRVDGFEATIEIRKISAYNHIVIIALSGDTAVDDIRKMSEAGMEEHLEKPLRIESLYDIIYAYTQSDSIDDTGLDTEEGLSVCGYDEEFYHEILDEFVNTYSESQVKLQEFLNANKMKEADKYLLDLSGITANIGAINTSKIVLDFKEAINDPQERRYAQLLKEYAKSLHNLLEDIKKYQKD